MSRISPRGVLVEDAREGRRIKVTSGGPYLVAGDVPLVRLEIVTNEQGESVGWREVERLETYERYSLCRCGHSRRKPFCDGSHMDGGFEGTETAGHESYASQAVSIDGPGVRLHDARKLCAEARFCDRAGGLWNLVDRCDDDAALELAAEEAQLCPSGRYVLCEGDEGGELEPSFEPSIALIEDPHLGVSGPLFVRGGIPVFGSDGEPYEVRNRVTLCRCGHSANKPFCDGSHLGANFDDGHVHSDE
jgi:CDGSH-type Zn-finger protein